MLAGYSTTYIIVHMCKDSPTSYSLILPIKSHEYVPRATLHMPLFHSPIQSVTLKVIGLHNNRCFCNNSFQRAAKKSVFQRCSSSLHRSLSTTWEIRFVLWRDVTWQCHCPPWGTSTRPVTPTLWSPQWMARWATAGCYKAQVAHQSHTGVSPLGSDPGLTAPW